MTEKASSVMAPLESRCSARLARDAAVAAVHLILALVVALLGTDARAEFVVSAERSCMGTGIYGYHFSSTAVLPDFTVKVSAHAVVPDLRIRLVSDPRQADLLLADGVSPSSMRVCKQRSGLSVTTIKVSKFAVIPDTTVQLSRSNFLADHKLFVASEIFSEEEAAALFAVIWESNRRK